MQISKRTVWSIITLSIILILPMSLALATNNETVDENTTSVQDAAKVDTPGKFRLPPSVSLTSTKTNVEATDPAILTLSMINPSANDMSLDVDVIIKAPSGVYVTATSFASSGSNQNIGHFVVRPGEENHVTIQITSTELGEKAVESQVTYYPEGNKDEYRTLQQTMSVYVKEKSKEINPEPVKENSSGSEGDKVNLTIPGFSGILSIACMAIVLLAFRRK